MPKSNAAEVEVEVARLQNIKIEETPILAGMSKSGSRTTTVQTEWVHYQAELSKVTPRARARYLKIYPTEDTQGTTTNQRKMC